ncbi:MAG: two-component system nitrate/nitrite response regulator NarL [Sphingobacteriales bacterium]|jgi:two-component system nitrate/nitrite response regulator NarL
MIHVFICDDHPLVVDGLTTNLASFSSIEVTGSASNGKRCIEAIKDSKIDILLLDISMPEMDGLEASAIIKDQFPWIKIIILSSFDDPEKIKAVHDIGVEGYLLKTANQAELLRAIEIVSSGGTNFSHHISSQLRKADQLMEPEEYYQLDLVKFFTRREYEIMEKILADKKSSDIAKELDIAESTVLSHRKNIYIKADVHSSTGLIRFAMENGYEWGDDDEMDR